ncbi:hypothetical protein BDF19DRAFT_443163 [Syncephalis fuscata]|nr:hypothetical protein BDF19DRAFT_443163 [Syncephalis fuscata]
MTEPELSRLPIITLPSPSDASSEPRTPTRPFTYEASHSDERGHDRAVATTAANNSEAASTEAIRLDGNLLGRHLTFSEPSLNRPNTGYTNLGNHTLHETPDSEDEETVVLHDSVTGPHRTGPSRGPYRLLQSENSSDTMDLNDRRVAANVSRLDTAIELDGQDVPLTPIQPRKGQHGLRGRGEDIIEEENEDDDEEDGDAWLHMSRKRLRDRGASFSTILLEDVAGHFRRKFSFAASDTSMLGGRRTNAEDGPVEDSPLVVALQTLPSLLVAVVGLIMAGWLLDVVQHWTVFTHITQLFIMVPVLLGLKGNLEMNLASRMSTAANLGDLDVPKSQRLLVWGNLALLQLQALSVSCLAGLLSVIMGFITHGSSGTASPFSFHQAMLIITSAMICAAVSSALLGLCMCFLCIACRRRGINPDNVATPIAASFGDLITLAVLAIISSWLYPVMDTIFPTVLFIIMLFSLPVWFWLIRKNELIRETMFDGWVPILLAMAISSLAGLVLERFIDRYAGIAVLVPVLNGVSGNLCCVFASRISTALHARRQEKQLVIGVVLWLLNLPVQWPFLGIVRAFNLGHGSVTVGMFLLYTLASMLLVAGLLVASRWIVVALWHRSLDPDNYALPYITAIGDVAGTCLLVLVFIILQGSNPSIEATAIKT